MTERDEFVPAAHAEGGEGAGRRAGGSGPASGRPPLGWAAVTRGRANRWLPVLLWAGLIFALSSVPGLGTGLGTWDLVLRKLAHVAEYAVLGALLQRALSREPLALVLGSGYAVTDEIHQAFVSGRQGSALDWLIDTVGVAIGVLLYARWAASRETRT